ncbi:crossover junction endodeoxyribonuclease RuvC [Streptomyces sp. CNQ085]|nr:crossover junction endodeoxyribonuclease RuvC [Streptomyces sp. CNQ085]MCI0383350.1 crossover junction endodeoxyribonuclease RuvC [Streptomyces sp. CNQ085]
MRVLGVDPGLTRCGIGVVEGVAGRPLRMDGVGVVRTSADAEVPERLVLVERGLEEWLEEYRPDVVAVERVFSQHNVRTVMGTAQASAVAMLCAARRGLPVVLHTPSEVKAAVTGTGRADKAQVGAMVTRLLRLDAPPKPADAADALALAICHIWRAPAQDRLRRARLQQAHHRQAGHQQIHHRQARAAPVASAAVGAEPVPVPAPEAAPARRTRRTSEDSR